MKNVDLLGVSFQRKTTPEYKRDLAELIGADTQTIVVTPNPEMLVAGRSNAHLRHALNQASLRIVDGVGLVIMSGVRLHRWPGVDVLAFLAWETNRRGLKMLLAGGMHEGDAQLAADALKIKYPVSSIQYLVSSIQHPASRIKGFSPGRIELTAGGWVGDQMLKEAIERERPDVLALALGHGKQELWLADHLKNFPFMKLAIGVGGALEFYAGRQRRAPMILRQAGLEWLYRLVREPRRLKRILTAVVIFPILVALDKIKHTL